MSSKPISFLQLLGLCLAANTQSTNPPLPLTASWLVLQLASPLLSYLRLYLTGPMSPTDSTQNLECVQALRCYK